MRNPTIFLAYYEADPTGGGLCDALRRERIEVKSIPGQRMEQKDVPGWVVCKNDVQYYFLVSAELVNDAARIARELKHPTRRFDLIA